MTLTFPDLPFAMDALEPYYPAKMVYFHYERHHRAYFDKLTAKIKGTRFEQLDLEQVIQAAAGRQDLAEIFNNAAQFWNHNAFWASLQPNGGGRPSGEVQTRIDRDFGSYEAFRRAVSQSAAGRFGSGWVWLTFDGEKLAVTSTANAGTPLTDGLQTLLALDVWEHAYYLEYQDRRADYVDVYLDRLVNWQHANEMLATAAEARTDHRQARRRHAAG